MRYLTGAAVLLAATVSCSRGNDRPVAATPTAPSAATATTGAVSINFVGGVSGPMDVVFPGRQDPLQFRNELETKYQQMGRPATSTYVDREGEVIWTQEYVRYRVNGCDHATAVQRVFTQIDNGAAGGICTAPPDGVVNFPPRNEILQFRQQLETKYQQMGRGLTQTFVDIEGSLVWTQEYLRYRVNACDHATATQKVFSQIDGGPVPATCFVPCSFRLTPSEVSIGSAAASATVEIRPNPTPCAWTAASDASWLTIPGDNNVGSGFFNVPYNVAVNNGGDRTGRIKFTWSGGEATFTVYQQGTPFIAGFTMNDTFRGATNTTECHFRSSSTPCLLTAFANLPGNTYTYNWEVTYFYGTLQKRHSLTTTASNTFTFNDQCGGTNSSSGGTVEDMSVTHVISDERGNTITIRSGANGQPALFVRQFTC
jgi:hypothetical protein